MADLDGFTEMHRTLTAEKVMCRRLTLDRKSGGQLLVAALQRLLQGTGTYILVEQKGELVGEAFANRSGHEYCTVGLALIERVRGAGIGTRLMSTLESECRRLGAKRLHLAVYSANDVGVHVYEKAGYRECGRRTDWVQLDDGSTSDLVDMTKMLD